MAYILPLQAFASALFSPENSFNFTTTSISDPSHFNISSSMAGGNRIDDLDSNFKDAGYSTGHSSGHDTPKSGGGGYAANEGGRLTRMRLRMAFIVVTMIILCIVVWRV